MIVFIERGPLYLVAAAATGEPVAALAQQLGLLHSHLVAVLTDGFDRTLARNPRFEPRRLLGAPRLRCLVLAASSYMRGLQQLNCHSSRACCMANNRRP